MDDERLRRTSKLLSLILRHDPARAGLALDEGGWARVADILAGLATLGAPLSPDELLLLVRSSDKQRFAFSEDGQRLRASQGHSVDVDLGYAPSAPPEVLFHGTVERFLASIREHGLRKGERHHVHLSATEATARQVGGRRGRPVLLEVRAQAMVEAGHVFFQSANGVWLTEHVPPPYLVFPRPGAGAS